MQTKRIVQVILTSRSFNCWLKPPLKNNICLQRIQNRFCLIDFTLLIKVSLKSVKSNSILPESHQTCWRSQGVMPYKIITHGHHHTGNRKPNYIKCDLWLDFVLWCRKKVTLSLYTIVSKCTHILREMKFYYLHT